MTTVNLYWLLQYLFGMYYSIIRQLPTVLHVCGPLDLSSCYRKKVTVYEPKMIRFPSADIHFKNPRSFKILTDCCWQIQRITLLISYDKPHGHTSS